MVPNFKFLHALIVAACVTPTDPVLSNSIVKGKFADKHVPRPLQRIIVAESGANDGLGYPFLFFGIYLLKYVGMDGEGYTGWAGKAMGQWFLETWLYTIVLSVVYGIVVGWLSRKLLHWAEEKRYVDRESFLVFAIALAVSTALFPDHMYIPDFLLTLGDSFSLLELVVLSELMTFSHASLRGMYSHRSQLSISMP
jgi:NhaP-type Na+/H+ or K+/H+ antiporter